MSNTKIATNAANWWIKLILTRYEKLNPDKIINGSPNFIIYDDAFVEALSRLYTVLIKEFKDHIENGRYININCLHFPGKRLLKLLQQANFSQTSYLPLRKGAEMVIHGKSIQISLGTDELRPLSDSDLYTFKKADLP